ncbi:hypothetical protein R1sor_016226 [Riccia sorocarpa]|uniref:Uncharacterized protein n=1 Tax=Riccia sorocarpa TaxID=122646 RepID=A0ABD3HH60_9MARC
MPPAPRRPCLDAARLPVICHCVKCKGMMTRTVIEAEQHIQQWGRHESNLQLVRAERGIKVASVASCVTRSFSDGDRLLIKGCNGQTCVVGWHEIAVAFGASHSETEEFRAIKINNKNFSQYRAGDFLMETVETNAQRKLVNGQPYEEISYYKDAAPYGPTYFLMNVIAELFWCNGRSTRFTTPMVYAYMRSLHGFQTNWAKVHLSKEGDIDIRGLHAKFPTPIEDLKVIRDSCKLSDNIPIAEPDLDDEPIPQPKSHSSGSPDRQVWTRYTKRRNITVGARNDPGTSIVPYDDIADGKRTVEPIFDDFGTKLGVIFGELASRKLEEAFWPMLADSKATEALKDQLADKCAKMQEAERQRADLNDQLTALKASLLRNNEKAAKQLQTELDQVRKRVAEGQTTISKLETDLQVARQDVSTRDADRETLKAEVKSLRGQLEASKIAMAAKQAKLEQENSDLQDVNASRRRCKLI